jgi:hypothetical protein
MGCFRLLFSLGRHTRAWGRVASADRNGFACAIELKAVRLIRHETNVGPSSYTTTRAWQRTVFSNAGAGRQFLFPNSRAVCWCHHLDVDGASSKGTDRFIEYGFQGDNGRL